MTTEHTKNLRYLKQIPGIPIETTLGKPYAVDGVWVVRVYCPDGKVRTFRTVPPKTTRRVTRHQRVRFEVLARDGFRCFYCGRTTDEVKLVVDHIVPVVAGGSDDMANLVTACPDCNIGKADRRLEPVGEVAPIVAQALFAERD